MITKVNDLEKAIDEQNLAISVVQWYELIASIAYWYARGCSNEEKTTEKIRATKPQFTEEQIKAGYSTYVTFKNAA